MTQASSSATEAEIRLRLGVPEGAARVMVVTESTHWDPNCLFTSTEYFRLCVRRTLDRAIDALLAEPRRVFSVECAFFPDLYWDHQPSRRGSFRDLVNEGRLRFTGSGVTTPDTLLPDDELLLRDLLIGQEWLRSRGMTQEPRVLYLPDSFGHSPGVPSLLAAAGVPYAAVCRIDGMRFPGADMEPAANFPRPGSSAELLLAEGTADFVWRGPDGSEALAHWQAYGYGHGDMIASGGLSRALGLPTAWPDRRERHVAARINRYIDQLFRVARTPYLCLAIGFDFVRRRGAGPGDHPSHARRPPRRGRRRAHRRRPDHPRPHVDHRPEPAHRHPGHPPALPHHLPRHAPARRHGHPPTATLVRPTFWPLHSFAVALPDTRGPGPLPGLAVAAAVATALHAKPAGTVETVVARTAVKELAFGAIPVLAPAWGRKWGTQHADIALRWVDDPDPATVIQTGRELARRVDQAAGRQPPRWLIEADDPLVEVIAVKLAHRGDGVVVRLRHWGPPGPPRPVVLTLASGIDAEITAAWRTDSRERDLGALVVDGGAARLGIDRYLTTARLSIR